MKRLLIFAGAILLLATAAMAQPDPDLNGLGLYFEPADLTRCRSVPTGLASIYLVATNISQPAGISGWDGQVFCDNPRWLFLSATVHGTYPLNALVPPDFMIGFRVPMEWAPLMLLVTLQYFVQDVRPTAFRIGPASFASIPGTPCFADGESLELIPFVPPAADWQHPVAWANGTECDIVGASPATWGGIKGLYRP